MTAWTYTAPASLDEAVVLLGETAGARALAGGHSLLIEPGRSRLDPTALIDLRKIPGLANIQVLASGGVQIGAMATLAAIAEHAAVRERCPLLAEAIPSVGDAQVRNRATIGGNLADNDPASDLPAIMLALDAQLHIAGPGGTRAIGIEALITGPFQTSLAANELITAIVLEPAPSRSGSAYEKFKHPATLYAICGIAASVTLADDGSVSACRVAVTGAATHAARLRAVEEALSGKQPDEATLAAAAQAGTGLSFQNDRFASAEYREHLTSVLTRRALARAVERAG